MNRKGNVSGSSTSEGSISRREKVGFLYILPWLIGFLLLTVYPMICSLVYCFYKFDFLTPSMFVGLRNFRDIFAHPDFLKSVKATGTYVLFAVPAKLLAALALALLLNVKLKGINLYRTVYYIPSIVGSSVAIGILWRMMFNKDGMINSVLGILGIAGQSWLGSPKTAIYVLCVLPMWQVGSSMVTFLAALKQVPEYLYEAAKVDGAGPLTRFFRITLPMISPIILFNLVMQAISAFQEFNSAYVVTNGGPIKSTYFFAMFIYEQSFKLLNFGFASALSWLLFAAVLVITMLIFFTSAKWVFYTDGGDII